jgi:hypothetical protein
MEMWVSMIGTNGSRKMGSYIFSVFNHIKHHPLLEIDNSLTHSYTLEDFNVE